MVRSLAFAPDGKTLASNTVGGEGAITLWDVGTGRVLATLRDTPPPLWRVAFAPDGKTLAATCTDHSVGLWDVAAGVRRRSIPCAALARSLAYAPDGRILAIGLSDGDILLWDPAADRRRALLHAHKNSVTDLTFAPAGRELASTAMDGTIRLWDFPVPPAPPTSTPGRLGP
jgi:WD40 repeat protein